MDAGAEPLSRTPEPDVARDSSYTRPKKKIKNKTADILPQTSFLLIYLADYLLGACSLPRNNAVLDFEVEPTWHRVRKYNQCGCVLDLVLELDYAPGSAGWLMNPFKLLEGLTFAIFFFPFP